MYYVSTYFVYCPIIIVLHALPIWPSSGGYALLYLSIGISFLLQIIFLIWTGWMFVAKLYKVFKYSKTASSNKQFLALISKNTVLAVITVCGTLCHVLLWVVVSSTTKGIAEGKYTTVRYLLDTVGIIDEVSNFICIMLSYKFAHKYYQSMCGGIDKKCQNCCAKCAGSQQEVDFKQCSVLSVSPSVEQTQITQSSNSIVYEGGDTPGSQI